MSLPPALVQWIRRHQNVDPAALTLKYGNKKGLDFRAGIAQIHALQKAKIKLPQWSSTPGIVWPPALSIEQCSSEATARFKSTLGAGHIALDLTGGAGVDCYYLSRSFEHMVYVESDRRLCDLATHNFKCLDANNIRLLNMRAEDYIGSSGQVYDMIFVDPSRRQGTDGTASASSKKTFRIEEGSPDIRALLPALRRKTASILIKLSPLLDLSRVFAVIDHIAVLYVVAVDDECKELLVHIAREGGKGHIEAVHLDKKGSIISRFRFRPEDERSSHAHFAAPGHYLYEPNAALLKAGAFKSLAGAYGVNKLHPNTHLYTSDQHIAFPGNTYRILAQIPYNRQAFAHMFRKDHAMIKCRNFPDTVREVKKKLKVREGQSDVLYGVTLANNKPVLLHCTKANSEPTEQQVDTAQQQ